MKGNLKMETGNVFIAKDTDIEILRLKIMEEVGLRFKEMVEELDRNGTEFSRALRIQIENEREIMLKDLATVIYKTDNLDQSVKIITGLMKKTTEKVDLAAALSRDAAACTFSASQHAQKASESLNASYVYSRNIDHSIKLNGWIHILSYVAVLITVLGIYVTYSEKSNKQIDYQRETVQVMREKISQDAINQVDLGKMIDNLEKTLKKSNTSRPSTAR